MHRIAFVFHFDEEKSHLMFLHVWRIFFPQYYLNYANYRRIYTNLIVKFLQKFFRCQAATAPLVLKYTICHIICFLPLNLCGIPNFELGILLFVTSQECSKISALLLA